MKITNISINDFGTLHNCQLNNFGAGLNVVHGEKSSGKSTVRDFLRGMLQGFDSRSTTRFDNGKTRNANSTGTGSIEIADNSRRLRLTHDVATVSATAGSHRIRTEVLDGDYSNGGYSNGRSTVGSEPVTDFARRVDTSVYDQILNVGFRDDTDDSQALTSVLHSRFNVPLGRIEKPTADVARIRELETAIAGSRELISELTSRREFLLREIRERDHRNVAEIEELSRLISGITDEIRATEASIASMQQRLRDLDIAIDDLRAHIERIRNQVETVRVKNKADRMPELLSRLDAVEQQILRWRKVHQDVQTQRNKLRDDMVAWSAEDLSDKQLLPFEDVRELLSSIEGRVGDLDEYVARIQHTRGDHRSESRSDLRTELRSDLRQDDQYRADMHRSEAARHNVTGPMQKTLSSMREELYQLCRELNSQHLVYRRKTTVHELKQLRRCHVEVTDHVKRLVSRRESLLAEIARIDPARAELIVKSQHELCDCNYHDQYLAERQLEIQDTYVERRVDVDVSAELARLHQMEDDRRRLHADINAATSDLTDSIRRRDESIRRRDSLKLESVDALRRELADIERRVVPEQTRLEDLLRQLEAARRIPEVRPNALLESASRYLARLSGGDLQQVRISQTGRELVAADRRDSAIVFPELSREGRDQVRLAICLAANNALLAEGIHLPLVLDDALVNMDETSRRDVAEVLADYCRDNRQVILFTRQQSVVSILSRPGVQVIEMPAYRAAPVPVYEQPRYESPRYEGSRHERPIKPIVERPIAQRPVIDRSTVEPRVEREYIRREVPRAVAPRTVAPNTASPRTQRAELHAYDYIEPENLSTRSLVDATRFLQDEEPVRHRETRVSGSINESTHLADTRLMGSDNISVLRRLGVRTVGDLLNFDPCSRSHALSDSGIDLDQIDTWQSQSLLMLVIPQLRATDAVMLYNCGLTDADKIAAMESGTLNTRIREFAGSTRGRRMFGSGYSYDKQLVGDWIGSARANRDRYRSRRRWSRSSRSSATTVRDAGTSRETRHSRPVERSRVNRSDNNYGPRAYQPRESENSESESSESGDRESATRELKNHEHRNREREVAGKPLKFYLELNADVEAAPSIGPRMAERLAKIGVHTVKDLLEETPENIAERLKYKRVTADHVRAWQKQATLVCRIPQLRGHDAQFLVACDIADPDRLASMQPAELFKIIGPFSRTKEGQKICRSGKAPDLAEVTDWIDWSKQTRRLNAA